MHVWFCPAIRRHFFQLHLSSEEKEIQEASWTNAGDSLLLVRDGDLFIMASPEGNVSRITASGSEGVFNALPDPFYRRKLTLGSLQLTSNA